MCVCVPLCVCVLCMWVLCVCKYVCVLCVVCVGVVHVGVMCASVSVDVYMYAFTQCSNIWQWSCATPKHNEACHISPCRLSHQPDPPSGPPGNQSWSILKTNQQKNVMNFVSQSSEYCYTVLPPENQAFECKLSLQLHLHVCVCVCVSTVVVCMCVVCVCVCV